MQIDQAVEAKVREAFSRVIAQDRKGMITALDGLSERDTATALSYAVIVCGYIANNVYPDGVTTETSKELAASAVADLAGWVDLGSKETVGRFLEAAAKGDTTFTGFPKEDLLGHAFVVGGYLLATCRDEGQEWYEYLDEIWNTAEAVPDPG